MEALTSNTTFDYEERALKSLFDRFGSALSLEYIRSTFCKAGRDADLAGELLSVIQTNPSDDTPHVSNGSVKIGTSKGSDNNGFIKPCYANGNCDEKPSRLNKNSVSWGALGKEYVWRARAGQDANLACEVLLKSPSGYVSNRPVKSETISKSSDDTDFGNSCYANGNCEEKPLGSKRTFVTRGTFGKQYVWRSRAGQDANLSGEVLSGTLNSSLADISHVSNGMVKSETSSRSSDDNGVSRPGYANRNSDEIALNPKSNSVSRGTTRKQYVWRVKVGQDANLGEVLSRTAHVPNNFLTMDTNSRKSCDDNAFNSNSCYANGNDDSKVSKLEKVHDSTVVVSSVHAKDYVRRVRAGEDANLADNCVNIDTNTRKSCDDNAFNNNNSCCANRNDDKESNLEMDHDCAVVVPSYAWGIKTETFSQSSGGNGFNNLCYPNSICGSTQSRLKNNSASLDRVSSVPGKDYVWRPKGQDANHTSETSLSNGEVKSQTSKSSENNDSSKSCFAIGSHDSQALRLKGKPVFTGSTLGVVGKDYVWRVRTNGIPNGEKFTKTEENKNLQSVHSSGESLSRRDADSSVKKDFEDFLLDMLGRGFQLEKSAIQEVLGNSGYDMQKSLEAVLDLAARTLDRRNGSHKGINLNSNPETFSSQNEGRKQKLAESGSRTMRYSGILSGQPNERHKQPKEGLTGPFPVLDRPDSTFSAPVSVSTRRSEVIETTVSEPQEDIAEEHNAKTTSCDILYSRDEATEDSYQILRKTVQEYRDTAKEYYKAAVEAYANGDRAQASILLEKGQSFSNKAREADEQSAEKIFEIRSRDGEMQDDMCLDLQHHDAKEAVRLVKCHLLSLSGNSFNNLKIIVGVGLEDVEKRKRLVIKLLEREAIEWIEDENSGTIAIRLDKINPKCLSFARR